MTPLPSKSSLQQHAMTLASCNAKASTEARRCVLPVKQVLGVRFRYLSLPTKHSSARSRSSNYLPVYHRNSWHAPVSPLLQGIRSIGCARTSLGRACSACMRCAGGCEGCGGCQAARLVRGVVKRTLKPSTYALKRNSASSSLTPVSAFTRADFSCRGVAPAD